MKKEITILGRKINIKENNAKFFKAIFPPLDKLLSFEAFGEEVKNTRNHWIHINIVIYGRAGAGKTELVNYIVSQALKIYQGKVTAVTTDGNLGKLIFYGIKYNPHSDVFILFSDNLTYEKIPREDMQNFYRIRHIAAEITKRNIGYIVTIVATHRFHDIPPAIRQDPRCYIIKSAPTIPNSYDWNFIQNLAGEWGMKFLNALEKEKITEKILKGWAIVYMDGESYPIYTPSVPMCMHTLEFKSESEKIKYPPFKIPSFWSEDKIPEWLRKGLNEID